MGAWAGSGTCGDDHGKGDSLKLRGRVRQKAFTAQGGGVIHPASGRMKAWLAIVWSRFFALTGHSQSAAPAINRLEAWRATVAASRQWEMLDDVRLLAGTNQIRASGARLLVAGEQPGRPVFEFSPPN